MKHIKPIAIIIGVIIFSLAVYYQPVSKTGIAIQVGLLCRENPSKNCEAIHDYCYEALYKGNECYLLNSGL